MYSLRLCASAVDSTPALRTVIIWHHLGPYHLARARAVAGLCDLTIVELSAAEPGCGWSGYRRETSVPIVTLSGGGHLWRTLGQLDPAIVFIAGYGSRACLSAAFWSKAHGRRAVLFSETTPCDRPRHPLRERCKGALVRALFDRAIVGGRRQTAYLTQLGFTERPIDSPYNVVDNDAFRYGGGIASAPYFLYVGRLAPEKNLRFLLRAHAAYRRGGGQWDLVIAGEGPLRAALEAEAPASGVRFVGPRLGGDLVACYASAGCLVLPSLSEPWGLVLNEAMAAGLPVLASTRCGSADDLIEPGVNGWLFDPAFEPQLTAHLHRVSSLAPEERARMGAASARIIRNYSLGAWAAAFERALAS